MHTSTSWCQDPRSDLCVRSRFGERQGPQPDLSSRTHSCPVLRTNVIWGRWSVPSSRPTCWSVRWPHCCSGSPQTSRCPLLLCWSYCLGSGLLCPWVYSALGASLSSCSTCFLGTRPRIISPSRRTLIGLCFQTGSPLLVAYSNLQGSEGKTFVFKLNFYFEIIFYLYEGMRNNTERCHTPLIQFPLLVTSCKTVVQDCKWNTDVNTVLDLIQISWFYLYFCVCAWMCACVFSSMLISITPIKI